MSTSSPNERKKLRVVLFVEGTSGPALEGLWGNEIAQLLSIPSFERVVGFSKHNMVAMSNANIGLKHKTSTISVGLDVLIARELTVKPFDCAVVAWDLVPSWDSGTDASACRWKDTLLLYEGLSRSERLPVEWRMRAEQRFKELNARDIPSRRLAISRPAPFAVLGICMEPEFEGMLMDEAGVKAILGLKGKVRGWPNTWERQQDPRPSETLSKAIEAARKVQPKPMVFRKIRLPLREAKHEWGRLLIKESAGRFRDKLLNHPISKRLLLLLAETSGKF
jgi:hypothetical protein